MPEGKKDIEAIADVLKVVAENGGGELGIAAVRYEHREDGKETLFSMKIGSDDAAEARRGALLAQRALEYRGDADHKNVLMYLYQTNTDEPRAQGPTGDRAIIRAVSEKPLPVFFASDLDQDRFQAFKGEPGRNPFKASYRVDVNVETDRNDIPRFYRVLRLHEIIPGDDHPTLEQSEIEFKGGGW